MANRRYNHITINQLLFLKTFNSLLIQHQLAWKLKKKKKINIMNSPICLLFTMIDSLASSDDQC